MGLAIGDESELLADAVTRFTNSRSVLAEARKLAESASSDLPSFWHELDSLGWLTVSKTDGLGFTELAVVLEALGRNLTPGPVLATAWGRALASIAGHDVDGTVAVVLESSNPVLGGAVAQHLIVSTTDSEKWALIPSNAGSVTSVRGLDGAANLARIEAGTGGTQLTGVTTSVVHAVGIVLASAEALGGASWCVDTAAEWARTRKQFGRPIGQFQGVKHRCANMLARLELARAAVWDAASALDSDDPFGPEAEVAIAAAGALALDAFVDNAKDAIQILGGIGFTWEHDAHMFLRRAVTLRQLFGDTHAWRCKLAENAITGTRRHLTLELPPEAEQMRSSIAAVADSIAALPKEKRRTALADAGLIVPNWPTPWGRGAGAVEQVVIDEELRRVRVRAPHLQVGAWAAPTIAAHGTPSQQERWVRPTLTGEINWCQLFSEPEAGSDLASLSTKATATKGGWLLNGQKVWTSMAKEADWGICLARTNTNVAKHLGITYFIVDMKSPGLDIRPLRELTGMEMFNEVFFNDVFVPDDCVIGEVDGGWPLARTTLANERVSMGSGSSFGGGIEALIALVAELTKSQSSTAEQILTKDALGALVAEAHALSVIGLRVAARSLSGAQPGPEASVRKLLGVEHDQRTQEMGLSMLGAEGATVEQGLASQWSFGFLANRCLTIAGGTSEIQRNVIAERLLGLPRDPEPTS